MALKDDILEGVAWKTVAQTVGEGASMLFTILLVRLLTPEDFGLFGMILVFTDFAQSFGRLGFGAALVQRKELSEAHRSSVFWLNIGAGLVLAGAVAGAAPLIALFYGEPRLVEITIVVSLNFILTSLVIVQRSLQKRKMNFDILAYVKFASIFASGLVGVGMALTDYGVWSLVGKVLTSTAVTGVALWVLSNWRPRWLFDWSALKELLDFSAHTFGFQIYNFWAGKADDVLVGKYIGSFGLGIYTRAYETMLIPVQQITSTLSDVMFPALSKIQDEKDRVRRLYLRAISAIGLVTIPLMLLLLVVTDSFVLAVFGPKWSGVIPVLQILCLAGVILPIASTVGWIFRSQGRADWQFYWGLFGTSVTLGLTVLGTWLGVELSITPPDPGAPLAAYAPASDVIGATCVGASYVVAKCLLVPGSYYFAGKLIDMKVREVPLALKEVFASAVTAAIAIYALEETVTDGLGPWLELGIQAPTGILLYLAIVHLFQVDAYLDVRKQLFDKWREFQGVD